MGSFRLQRDKISICILRVGGTNRDGDAAQCFRALGADVRVLHYNDLMKRRDLSAYHGLVLPGGFAYGDYVRAGAILGKKLASTMNNEINRFVEIKKPVLGICNGFQVLVEAGVIPGFTALSDVPEAALAPNKSGRFECRWISLKVNRSSPCIFTKGIEKRVRFPIAHGEGRFILPDRRAVDQLSERNQIALQYSLDDGTLAKGKYPFNPNGSLLDIAGICNDYGNVLGLMPHPEDAFRGDQMPNWVQDKKEEHGDGFQIFDSMLRYIEEKF
jgi:phosphoribosylformylglycinamidine synthase subunit PurQ / glutaminase